MINTGFKLVTIGLLLLSLAGFFGQFNFYCDGVSHFRLQYFLIGVIPLVFFAFNHQPRWMFISVVCIGLNLWSIAPWYFPQAALANSSPPLRVLTVNVNVKNRDYTSTIDLIRNQKPDIVAVVETNRRWLQELQAVQDLLPYTVESPRAGGFGIALLSKFPLQVEQVETIISPRDLHLAAALTYSGQRLMVVALHPPPPRNTVLFQERNQELLEMGEYVRSLTDPVIVLGDLNITMWSAYYQRFVHMAHLRNTRQGFGILPTWNTKFSIPLLQIPIDHVLVSPNLSVAHAAPGANIGSDHLPFIADIQL